MSDQEDNPRDKAARDNESSPYAAFHAVREEILKYKWIASEQAGRDIGFEAALLGWTASQRAPRAKP